MLAGVLPGRQTLVLHLLAQRGVAVAEGGHPVDHVDDEVVSVQIVEHHHVERGGGGALLLVATHMNPGVVGAAVGQAVDEPGIPVIGEDDRLVRGEDHVELAVGQAVRMLGLVLQPHQVHDVDEPHLQFREVPAQQVGRGERLQGGDVTGGGQHHVRRCTHLFGAGPLPDAQAAGAVRDRLVHGQEVGVRLLAGHHHVDVLPRTQAVVVGGQQGVCVRRQVHPHDLRALVDDVVDEAGILVAEAIVVLAPDMAGQKVIQASDRPSPRNVISDLQPLGVLIEHRVDDVDEGLVAVEQSVSAGQQVTLQPTLALVFGEHLDHPAGPSQVFVDLGTEELRVPLLVGRFEDRLQSVRRGLVRPEDPEVVRIEPHHIGEPLPEHPGRFGDGRTGRGHLHGVVAEVRQPQVFEQQAAIGVRVVAHPQVAARGQTGHPRLQRAVVVKQLLGAVGGQPVGEHLQVLRSVAGAGQRHLVRAPRSGGLLAVDVGRAGPALRRAEHNHRPGRPALVAGSGVGLDLGDLVEHLVEECCETPVRIGVVLRAVVGHLEEVGLVAVADHQAA